MMKTSLLGNHSHLFLSIFLIGMLVWMLVPAQEARAATITVNSAADNLTAGDGFCTLREAVRNANLSSGGDLTSGDCTAGDAGADTITFNSSLDGSSIQLTIVGSGEPDNLTGDLDIRDDLTITGNGSANTIIQANFSSDPDRVFQTFSGVNVVFNDLTITGGNRPNPLNLQDIGFAGAGILNAGNTTLNRVYVTNNRSGYRGGGIHNGLFGAGSITINASTIYSNTSGSSGAGIFSEDNTVVINNSTLSGNSGVGSGAGAAVIGGTMTLNFVTVTENTADSDNSGGDDGGGIRQFAGTLSVNSSIIANNLLFTTGDDCGGTLSSLGYNVTGTNCGLGGTGDTVANPLLGSLADNGGPTLTHAIATNSPAIDRATGAGCGSTPFNVDQRGYTRPIDGDGDTTLECDSGAYESLQVCSVTDNTSYPLGNVTFFVPTGKAGNIACFQVSEIAKNHPDATITELQTGKYWLLEAINGAGAAASGYTIDLTIDNLTFTPDTDDKLCRWDGSAWGCGTTNTPSGNSITRTGVDALSPWTAGNQVTPTAITLEALTARAASTPLTLLALALLTLALLFFISRKRDMARS